MINTEAPDVGLVKNKILYSLTTDKYLDDAGTVSVNRMKIVSVPDNGDKFLVAWDEYNVAIECEMVTPAEAAADTTGTKIRDDQATLASVAAAVALKLSGNALIDSLFTVDDIDDGGDKYVEFTAKQVGAKYDMVLEDLDAWHEWSLETAGGDKVYDGQFYLVTKIFVKNDAGDFEYLTDVLTKPGLDQSAVIDIASKIRAAVDDYTLPEVGQSAEIREIKIIREYKLLFFEKKPSADGALQPAGQITGKYAWFAGFTPDDFAAFPDPQFDWFAAGSRWLSWFPTTREVREDQDHFISFLNYDTSVLTGGGS